LPGAGPARPPPHPATAGAWKRAATVQRANASTRGITSRIGPIDEIVFHQIKQKLHGSPDVSHSIEKDGTIAPIGVNIFMYAAEHPTFERVFNSAESIAAYHAWKLKHPEELRAARARAEENERDEEAQKAKSRSRRMASDKPAKSKGMTKEERAAEKAARNRAAAKGAVSNAAEVGRVRDIYDVMNEYSAEIGRLIDAQNWLGWRERELEIVVARMLREGTPEAEIASTLDYYQYDGPVRRTFGLPKADFEGPYRR
jgi:hypothetical protein